MFKSKNNYTALYLTFTLFWGLCYGFVLLSSAAGAGELIDNHLLFRHGNKWQYKWESIILLNENGSDQKDVGFLLSSNVNVESIWNNREKLLKIHLVSPKLHIKSRKAPEPEGFVSHTSELDASINKPFYVLWQNGKIDKIFLAKDEPLSLANVKKGIASLFQFRFNEGEVTETDASGTCKVTYELLTNNKIRKTKSNCISEDLQYVNHPDKLMATHVDSNRHTTYTFNTNSLEEVTSNERHDMYISINEDVGNKVEVIQILKLISTTSNDNLINVNDHEEILNYINSKKTHYITESLLTENEPSSNNDITFTNAIQENRDNLKNNLLGTLSPAKTFLNLITIARQSNQADITKALSTKKNQKILAQIYDILGYVQTLNTHEAVMKKVLLDKEENDNLNERYLWSLSLSSQPNPDIINDLLKRFKKYTNLSDKIKETLLHTIATMTYRSKKLPENKRNHKIEKSVEEALLNNLEASKGKQESLIYLRALRNLRSETTIGPLLDIIKTGTVKEGVLAWKALKEMGKSKWNKNVVKEAHKMFFQLDKKQDSSARTLSLDILMDAGPSDELLKEFFYFLMSSCQSYEVKQYLLQTIRMMADSCQNFRDRIANIIRSDSNLYNYDIYAQRGLSTALKRPFLEHKSSNGSLLTMQEMFGGIVKRGIVNVVMSKDDVLQDIFSLGIFSGGLSSFISSDAEESDESATAGMELSILGTHVRPFVFFNNQGELMGHVWSGTASERTTAYQALAMLQDHLEYLRLGNGFIAEFDNKGVASFDLSGKIEFSLWNRNAVSLVEKSAGILIKGVIKVDTSFVKSKVEYNLSIEPKLHLQTDIDFSSNVNLCMRLIQPDSIYKHNIFKIERIPGSKHRLRKVKYKKCIIPGKTYSLNKKNNEMCNLIFKSN